MSDITASILVTRTELGLPDLDLNDGENYVFGRQIEVGAMAWRKEAVTSPFVDGRVPVHEVKDSVESRVLIYCKGSDYATLQSNIAALITAFTEQYSYELSITAQGIETRWTCERADYKTGYMTETLLARHVPVQFSFHRKPTPTVGVF